MNTLKTFSTQEISLLAQGYRQLYSGVVYDTLHEDIKPPLPYVLSKKIKPAWDFDDVLCGPAFTVQGAILTDECNCNNDYLALYEELYEGCVEMISSGIDRKLSVFGEITGKIVARSGAAGTIVDACARDIKGLKDDKFRVFSEGVSMLDALDRWRIVDYQKPLPFEGEDGDVWINPGDYIFADSDGVLVIPYDKAFEVLRIATERMIKENRIRVMIKNGASVYEIIEKEGRW